MTATNVGLTSVQREGRGAVYWSWYCSPRRADWTGKSWGRNNIGTRAYNHTNQRFGDYPGWRVLYTQPHQRYGVAGGRRGAKRKVHLVRDQIIAKHGSGHYAEERMTRWVCGSYTFQAILQPEADLVCSQCLLVAQHRSVEPLPKETR
jgi:hypothetical protein